MQPKSILMVSLLVSTLTLDAAGYYSDMRAWQQIAGCGEPPHLTKLHCTRYVNNVATVKGNAALAVSL